MLINYHTGRVVISAALSDEDRETVQYAITAFVHLFTLRERRMMTITGEMLKERILATYDHTPRIAAIINAIDRETACAAARSMQVERIKP